MSSNPVRSCVTAAIGALATLLGVGSASADVTHTLSLLGEVDFPTSPSHDFVWTGSVTVLLDSAADGQYDYGAGLLSFNLSGNWAAFSEPGSAPSFPPFTASLTVSGGRVTSIDAEYRDPAFPIVTTTFSGLSVDFDQPQIEKSPPSSATATLTEALSVPEPGTWLLMLAALAPAVVRRHGIPRARRRSSPCRRGRRPAPDRYGVSRTGADRL